MKKKVYRRLLLAMAVLVIVIHAQQSLSSGCSNKVAQGKTDIRVHSDSFYYFQTEKKKEKTNVVSATILLLFSVSGFHLQIFFIPGLPVMLCFQYRLKLNKAIWKTTPSGCIPMIRMHVCR